jgi:hypothetical protein
VLKISPELNRIRRGYIFGNSQLQRFLNDICTKSIKKVVAINELPLPFFMLHSIENCYKWVPI